VVSEFSGLSEEILFRGLIQTYLSRVFDAVDPFFGHELPLAGVITAVIFTVAHVGFTLSPLGVFYFQPPQLVLAFITEPPTTRPAACSFPSSRTTQSTEQPSLLHSWQYRSSVWHNWVQSGTVSSKLWNALRFPVISSAIYLQHRKTRAA